MLKVIIVDDDVSSRTGLKTMLDWETHGFCIAGEASNGASAIQLMQHETPDIVITDMNMPVMNGIGLIDYIEKHCPLVKTIALSAFDDFDYVRQSMKKGAMDYVLKHRMDAAALLDILETARKSLCHKRNEQDKQSEMYRELSKSKAILHQEFLRSLIEGSLTDLNEIQSYLESLKVDLDISNLNVTVAEIDDYSFIEEKFTSSEITLLIKTFLEISKEILNDWNHSMIVPLSRGKFVLIFSLRKQKSELQIQNKIYATIDRLRFEIKKYLNITASFGVGKLCKSILELHQAYCEADDILKDKFFAGKNRIFWESGKSKQEEGFICLDIKDEKAIYTAIRNLDYENAERLLEQIFNKISRLRLGSKSTQMICAELINIGNKVSKDTGTELSKIYADEDIPYNMILKHETISDLKRWILDHYKKLIKLLERLKINGSFSEVTKRSIEFIQQNYRKSISLADVANYAGVSSSYISRLFKEECKVGFAEYLNFVRIENAKLYIENGEHNLKTIVSLTGFNNYNYFFKVFKEIAGMTPLEYEQLCRKFSDINILE